MAAALAASPICKLAVICSAVGALLVLSLIGGLFISLRQTNIAYASQAKAETETAKSNKIAKFMEKLPETLGGGYQKTKLLGDKVVLHMLVVALILENFSLNKEVLLLIAQDFRVEVSSLTPFLLRLGCKTSSEKSNSHPPPEVGSACKLPCTHWSFAW